MDAPALSGQPPGEKQRLVPPSKREASRITPRYDRLLAPDRLSPKKV